MKKANNKMAMNKKEQAELAEAKKTALLNRALRWTDPVERDVPPPSGGAMGYVNGYDFNEYRLEAFKAWSGTVSHGKGHVESEVGYRSGSQNSMSLYSTPILALRAMRNRIEMEAAQQLAKIDAMIAAEIARALP